MGDRFKTIFPNGGASTAARFPALSSRRLDGIIPSGAPFAPERPSRKLGITSNSKDSRPSYAGDARVSSVQHSRSSVRFRSTSDRNLRVPAALNLRFEAPVRMTEGLPASVSSQPRASTSGRRHCPQPAAKKIALTRIGVCGHFPCDVLSLGRMITAGAS